MNKIIEIYETLKLMPIGDLILGTFALLGLIALFLFVILLAIGMCKS